MKTKYIIYFLSGLCLLFSFFGCSVKKNNALRRNYHALTTTYNVYFNGNEAFKRGNKSIEDSYTPNYAQIINMYAVSDPSTTGVAKGDMARAVEKAEKAIKEHSIRKKPKKNPKKIRDPKYMAFYNQEEFNPKMDDVWMLLGKAKFYSNDYLAASATFTYVINHFSGDKLLVAEAGIWKARSFKEMDWTYEAEDMLKKVSDDQFTDKLNLLYNGAYADLLIYQGELRQALPYLETCIALEKNRKMRTRYRFIAGQIYQQLGEKEKAFEMYDKVISAHPPYQMAFNARIRQTEVYTGDSKKDVVKSLEKMAKNSKNKDYLDQIYYAIGNIYLARKDTAKAIENYTLSVEKSTRDGLEKAQSYIALGDLYYIQEKYIQAQPNYAGASAIIDHEHPDYVRVSNLSMILDELALNYETVVLQDSLQHLASLSKDERLKIINNVIQQIIQEEIEEQKRRERELQENKLLEMEIENMAIMDQRALGNAQKTNFYFDNRSTVEKGKIEFQRRYGRRKLEDNWIRKNKTVISFSDDALADLEDELGDEDAEASEENKQTIDAENNPKRVEFYLRQIPFSAEQVAISNQQIAEALFNMGVIYYDKLEDYPKSIETFEEFARRFPTDPRVADAYFYCYRIFSKQQKENEALYYRDKLIAEFPESNYAKLLSQPDFREKLERMYAEQDSLYEQTYKAFLAGNFDVVKTNTAYMETNYPVSPLMPKFLLLKSISIGKSGDIDSFYVALNDLLARYPNSDVSSMAKDILALMTQGKTPEAGTPGSLMALREQGEKTENEEFKDAAFRVNNNTTHLFKLITDPAEVDENRLLYETATYNFTKFLVKDFDINIRNGILTVSGLENLEEALWYINGIFEDKGIQGLLQGKNYKYLIISEENNELIENNIFTIEEYEDFYKNNIANQKKKKAGPKVELIGDEKALEEISSEQTSLSNIKEGDDLSNANLREKNTQKQEKPQEEVVATEKEQPATDPVKTEKETPAQPEKEEQTTDPVPEKSNTQQAQTPKQLQKYKGLYTYDEEAPHYFAILLSKGGADFNAIKTVIDRYNNTSQALLNLNVTLDSGKGFPQIITVGMLPDAKVATSYILQVVKDESIKNGLKGVDYRSIAISQDNLKVLKESGNLTVYMELFRKLYLDR